MHLRLIVISLALVFALIVIASVAGIGFGNVIAGCGGNPCPKP